MESVVHIAVAQTGVAVQTVAEAVQLRTGVEVVGSWPPRGVVGCSCLDLVGAVNEVRLV